MWIPFFHHGAGSTFKNLRPQHLGRRIVSIVRSWRKCVGRESERETLKKIQYLKFSTSTYFKRVTVFHIVYLRRNIPTRVALATLVDIDCAQPLVRGSASPTWDDVSLSREPNVDAMGCASWADWPMGCCWFEAFGASPLDQFHWFYYPTSHSISFHPSFENQRCGQATLLPDDPPSNSFIAGELRSDIIKNTHVYIYSIYIYPISTSRTPIPSRVFWGFFLLSTESTSPTSSSDLIGSKLPRSSLTSFEALVSAGHPAERGIRWSHPADWYQNCWSAHIDGLGMLVKQCHLLHNPRGWIDLDRIGVDHRKSTVRPLQIRAFFRWVSTKENCLGSNCSFTANPSRVQGELRAKRSDYPPVPKLARASCITGKSLNGWCSIVRLD